MDTENTTLSVEQQAIVENFMQEFLPPCNPRQSKSNELMYLHILAEKIFKQKFFFSISPEQFLETCLDMGYQITTSKAIYDAVSRSYKPHKEGIYLNSNPLYKKHNAAFIYLNVDSNEVNTLMNTLYKHPPYVRNIKAEQKKLTNLRLMHFKSAHQQLFNNRQLS